MKIFYQLPLIFFFIFPNLSLAHVASEGKVLASLGTLVNLSVDSPDVVGFRPLFGGALTVEGDIGTSGGLEVALMLTENQYNMYLGDELLVERVNRMHIPLGYRWWFDSRFSFALSFFSAYRIGKVNDIARSANVNAAAKTSAHDTTEYGFDFSLLFDLWKNERYTVTLDTRYSLPVTDRSGEQAENYFVLLALKYEVQRKKQKAKS